MEPFCAIGKRGCGADEVIHINDAFLDHVERGGVLTADRAGSLQANLASDDPLQRQFYRCRDVPKKRDSAAFSNAFNRCLDGSGNHHCFKCHICPAPRCQTTDGYRNIDRLWVQNGRGAQALRQLQFADLPGRLQ